MEDFIINVRAIVHAQAKVESPDCYPHGWEVYDVEVEGDLTVIRCDTEIEVTADDEEEAIELAKAAAPLVELPDYRIETVKLWVDQRIDIRYKPKPAFAA